MPTQRLPRSFLFVPADRPERYAKAFACRPDAVIIDLEDAVAVPAKGAAREALRSWLGASPSPVFVRVNGIESEWFADDVALCAHAAVQGEMLPKAERAADVADVVAASPGKRVIPLVETARGMDSARELAAAPGVERLAFGSIDFKVDLAIDGDADELLAFRSHLVLASRLGGCASPIDGVSTAIDDDRLLASDTDHARRLGFGAKLCIHPRQVAIVNRAFTPGAESVAWARRVIAAIEQSGAGAVAVDGKMVDRPVLLQAQRILAQAGVADAHAAEGDARGD
jgi:citrate lyase subunit beta/citryl-CoA lyase